MAVRLTEVRAGRREDRAGRGRARAAVVCLAGCLAVITGAACGSSAASPAGTAAASAGAGLAAQVPASVRSGGTVAMGTSALKAPSDFIANGTIDGIEPELVKAAAQLLGLQVKITQVSFAGLIPALQDGRYQIGANNLNDTAAREKVVDFIDYEKSWSSIIVRAGNPAGILSAADLCGHKLTSLVGAPQLAYVQGLVTSCPRQGRKAPTVLSTTQAPTLQLQVESGQADALVASQDTAKKIVQESGGKLEVVPGVKVLPGYIGIVFPKKSALVQPFAAAMRQLVKNGTYARLMAKWQLTGVAIPAILVKTNG